MAMASASITMRNVFAPTTFFGIRRYGHAKLPLRQPHCTPGPLTAILPSRRNSRCCISLPPSLQCAMP